ncbi:MAG: flagellar motor protein MotB [Treponema sp. CETP13]|nr:MAG: flagellar motor protein MotB [Treponema sp. CETP13]
MKHIIKKIVIFVLTLFIVSAVFAQKNRVYISPNNDGVQDELIIPVTISDKRYVKEWTFIIENEKKEVVRTIGNKETRPEKMTFKYFWKQLLTPKTGVDVPEKVIWNGILDSGETASDGLYYYYLTAEDDNNNVGSTEPLEVYVDNTEPEIKLIQPEESSKIFGAGNKPTIKFNQSGSEEDLWTATIKDVSGKAVKSWTWSDGTPESIEWDGKNDLGIAVPEGVYSYSITATDRAGNVSPLAEVDNIIFDAIPRSVNLLVEGSPFSPKTGEGQQLISIIPSMSSSSGLIKWEISIQDFNKKTVKTWKGTTEPPSTIEYDGTTDDLNVLTDNDYKIVFDTTFNNGQSASISRNITVDTTKPEASVRTDMNIFSPDGDGNKDFLTIYQEGSKEKAWTGTIKTEEGLIVKTFTFGEIPDSEIIWDGSTANGDIVDGHYIYELSATDAAGNQGIAKTKSFELNTGTTEVILSVSPDSFSPNADGIKDELVFTPIIKTDTGISEYTLSILDNTGKVVRKFTAKRSLPKSIAWNGMADDGTRCSDGQYVANLYTLSKNGSEATINTRAFYLDSTYPEVKISTEYTIFSPNADTNKDDLPIDISTSNEDLWIASITNSKNVSVRDYTWTGTAKSFNWDGTDENGNIVPDGTYSFQINATDKAGNAASAKLDKIQIDNRSVKAYLTSSLDAFSPNGDGNSDVQEFSIMTSVPDGVANWSFNILDKTGISVRSWDQSDSENVPSSIKWDGLNDDDKIVDGSFIGSLEINYVKGDVVKAVTSSFISWVTPPQLTVYAKPEYFSPDNDGIDDEMYLALSGSSEVPFSSWSFVIRDPNNNNEFWSTSGKSTITTRMIWDGRGNNGELVQSAMNYPYEFTVTDTLGMTSVVEGEIKVDVLVIRVGDVLKMQVPSIIFRADNADFKSKSEVSNGLDQSVIDNNQRVLKRIAEILSKFKGYDVTIEGHANNISGTEAEETQDSIQYGKALVPLSEARADYVKKVLVEYGISESRLSTKGMGGRVPVAARSDKDNWWKNRRVEFILNK